MNNNDVFASHIEFKNIEEILTEEKGEVVKKYRKTFNDITKKLCLSEKPMYIVLSVNSYCNLKCKMCMRSFQNVENERRDLSLETIKHITEQCKNLGIPSIFLGATSECLLRNDIKDVIQCIKESGTIDNFLITNGTMLTEEICDFLVDIGYERVYISLDAATSDTYRKIRGGDLERVENNIKRLLEIRNAKGKKLPLVRVSFVKQKDNEAELDMFISKWKQYVDLIDIQSLIDYSGFSDLKEVDELDNKEFKCPAPFRMLYIDYYGDIYPCASDYCYHMKIGNISEMSIDEAWNSELMKRLRENINTGRLDKVCANCANNTDTE